MTSYSTTDYSAWKEQITKELKGSKSFEDFLNLDFLGQKLQRYYTLQEHASLDAFPQKLSAAALHAKSHVFNNYLWISEKTEALKHLSDGSYNGLFLENATDISSLDNAIDLGFVKTMVANGEVEDVSQFAPKGDYPITLLTNGNDNKETSFSESAIFGGYNAACRGAFIDTELALAIYDGITAVKNGCKKINIVLGFGPDDWFHLNVKLRTLPYLWQSALAESNLSCDSFSYTLKAIPTTFPAQDEYNHLLRQCMASFAAISHGADGILISPYTKSHLGEHASGRVATIIAHECFVQTPEDHYAGNYLLDFGSKILADAAWAKFEQLSDDNSVTKTWLENDKAKWLNDDRNFIGLNAYISEENSNIHPSFNTKGEKTFL